jgi:hypothetical protein
VSRSRGIRRRLRECIIGRTRAGIGTNTCANGGVSPRRAQAPFAQPAARAPERAVSAPDGGRHGLTSINDTLACSRGSSAGVVPSPGGGGAAAVCPADAGAASDARGSGAPQAIAKIVVAQAATETPARFTCGMDEERRKAEDGTHGRADLTAARFGPGARPPEFVRCWGFCSRAADSSILVVSRVAYYSSTRSVPWVQSLA